MVNMSIAMYIIGTNLMDGTTAQPMDGACPRSENASVSLLHEIHPDREDLGTDIQMIFIYV